jgi:hypothetical protein
LAYFLSGTDEDIEDEVLPPTEETEFTTVSVCNTTGTHEDELSSKTSGAAD